ncbi:MULTISPECIES: hypothetical protein [unclassified Bartonella]|uniref:hypothetical protein n=1 Tax=unclassified Bartonella TaxID=2645622 RepID=UPI0035CFCB58
MVPIVHTLYGQALQYQVASAKDDFAFENENRTRRLSSVNVRACCAHLADKMYNKGGGYDQK